MTPPTPPVWRLCPTCSGMGYVNGDIECPHCEGTGDRFGCGHTLPLPDERE